MNSSVRLGNLVMALLASGVFIGLTFLLPASHWLAMMLFDRAATSYPLTIQNVMWMAFFVTLGELYLRHQVNLAQLKSLSQNYLPTDPQLLLMSEDMPDIYRKVKDQDNMLAQIIRDLALRFQAGKSVEQTHEMLNSRLELWQFDLDIRYSMIRYLTWFIPTMGFIGTVVGIADTLNHAAELSPTDPDLLTILTADLGLAFNTTLVALVMSAVLVFVMHIVQSREEESIQRSGHYCLECFITRLYVG